MDGRLSIPTPGEQYNSLAAGKGTAVAIPENAYFFSCG
jgi:hypothetical protein